MPRGEVTLAKHARARVERLRQSVFSDRMNWFVFAGFSALIFLTAGSSRDDIVSLVFVRPIAILALCYGLLAAKPGDLRDYRLILSFIAALAAFFFLQLVPLPPDLWASLPGRAFFHEVAVAAEVQDVWRPITFSPSKTLNSLFSLSVPAAVAVLFAILAPEDRAKAPLVLLGAAVLCALLGILQFANIGGQSLYFYRLTSETNPVGLFANRNHFAVFLASILPIAAATAVMLAGRKARRGPSEQRQLAWRIAFLVVLTVCALLIAGSGSRAGVVCLTAMVLWSSWVLKRAGVEENRSHHASSRWPVMRNLLRFFWLVPPILAILAGIVAILGGQAMALERLFSGNTNTTRFDVLPAVSEMIAAYFPIGAGMGTFEQLYRHFEPDEMLGPLYLNRVHNDWLQFILEGGLVGAVLLLAALAFFAVTVFQVLRGRETRSQSSLMQLAAAGSIVAFMIASIVDYPVRVPSIMLTLTICFCILRSKRSNRTIA